MDQDAFIGAVGQQSVVQDPGDLALMAFDLAARDVLLRDESDGPQTLQVPRTAARAEIRLGAVRDQRRVGGRLPALVECLQGFEDLFRPRRVGVGLS